MQITKEEVLAKCNAASKNTLMETLSIEVIDYGFDLPIGTLFMKAKINDMNLWDRIKANPNVIHIHGDADEVFPIKYINSPLLISKLTSLKISVSD